MGWKSSSSPGDSAGTAGSASAGCVWHGSGTAPVTARGQRQPHNLGTSSPIHFSPHYVGFPCPEPCSTHLGWFAPPAACAPRGRRHPAGAAPPRAPTPETPSGGGSRLGQGRAGAEHPHCAGHPLRRQHRWGQGHPHPSAPPPGPKQVPVSPAGGQGDGVGSVLEMLQCCSTHCSVSRSSSVIDCVVGAVVLPGGARWGELYQPSATPNYILC